ncbi:MAG TPA: dipeptide epimerase [Candidatus Eremiobacteraceae bacterium]|nr:dipeptide epimerase [Candidatus Eremiobacteraceae bacterium]
MLAAASVEASVMARAFPSGAPVLRCSPLLLHLRHTFTIARSSEDVAESVLLELDDGELTGLGECAPSGRYEESPGLVTRQLLAADFRDVDLFEFDVALGRLGGEERGAMCALDIALHDLAGKRLGVPVCRLLGLDPSAAKETSFTVGIADIDTMVAKTKEAAHMPILKVKVGAGNEIETLEALRSVYRGRIRIDANEGWEPEQAVRLLNELARFEVEFCEQPVRAGAPERLRFVRERSRIPIMADESCRIPADIAPLAGCVDGIVIKLVKCGGMREAVAMTHIARALGMKIMIGCMIESSILATAGAHLTPLVDYADLDGPLLVTDDPYDGVVFDGAQMRLPDAPGLGVALRASA